MEIIQSNGCRDRFNIKRYGGSLYDDGSALKLLRTNLNYRVLGTSAAAIFLSNDNSLYAPISLDECHA